MKLAAVIVALLAITGVILWAHQSDSPLPEGTRADRVVVSKSSRTLTLYRGNKLLRSYRISLGRNPQGPKQREGDGRTPEGSFTLDYRKENSSFHRALHISYPTPDYAAAARGRAINPGGLIMVHGLRSGLGGLGRLHTFFDWTDGCVAVTNHEIDEIWRVVPDGTPIVIEP